MQPLPAPGHPGPQPRDLAEDVHSLLAILGRGWRLIVVSVLVCLTAALVYLLRTDAVYRAEAQLLVQEQGGQPLQFAGGGQARAAGGMEETLSTHVMIIRSPMIVERAVAMARDRGVTVGSVYPRLSIDVPDETAKVIKIGYEAESGAEAAVVLDSIIKSYKEYLSARSREYTNEVISLILEAHDRLGAELAAIEREYREFRERNTAASVDGSGRPYITRRLDEWDRMATEAEQQAFLLKRQLESARELARRGAGIAAIRSAVSQLGGLGGAASLVTDLEDAGGALYAQLMDELRRVEYRRQTLQRQLEHLRTQQTGSPSSPGGGDEGVVESAVVAQFYADPDVAAIREELAQVRTNLDRARRATAKGGDPAMLSWRRQEARLTREINRLWAERAPTIRAQLAQAGGLGLSVENAQAELNVLKAHEETLRDQLKQARADRLGQLRREYQQVTAAEGPEHPKAEHLRAQIAKLESSVGEPVVLDEMSQTDALLASIEESLRAIEQLQGELQERIETDAAASKEAELDLLTEADLRAKVERQRALFLSIADQLKQAQLVGDYGGVTAEVLSPTSTGIVRPPLAFILILALVAGCGLGTGAAYLVNLLDARLRSPTEVRGALALPVLGTIPRISLEPAAAPGEIGRISHAAPRSLPAESYRLIRTNLDYLKRHQDAQTILVTSPQRGEGKSTTASNLAISLAHAGRKVLLIDADLRLPCQHALHGVRRDLGLAQVLAGLQPFARAVQPTAVENLDLLAAGQDVPNPAELLTSHRLGELLEAARRTYEAVIIDSSPLLIVTDPSIIAAMTDGILLVVRSSVTRRQDAERAGELLRMIGIPILGVVINEAPRMGPSYGYGSYNAADQYGPIDGPYPVPSGSEVGGPRGDAMEAC